jgi:hypothetical protein
MIKTSSASPSLSKHATPQNPATMLHTERPGDHNPDKVPATF